MERIARLHLTPSVHLTDTVGNIEEIFVWKRDTSTIEELESFLEGTNYQVLRCNYNVPTIISDKGNEEQLLNGSMLPTPLIRREYEKLTIVDGIYPSGFQFELTKAELDINDKLYGMLIFKYLHDIKSIVQYKDGTSKKLSTKELPPDEDWPMLFDWVILSGNAWIKFKERHNIELDDMKWKPRKAEKPEWWGD